MTKEEVAGIVAYCAEHKVSQKQRLAELGISEWQFYGSKRRYSPKREGDNFGEFLQLIPAGPFVPDPLKPSRSHSARQKEADRGPVPVSIELRTPNGAVMRISGGLTGRELREIIEASSGNV